MKTPLIPLVGGVSRELIKFRDPSKADEIINLIPDLKKGLYTRPGLRTQMAFDYGYLDYTTNFYEIVEMEIAGERKELLVEVDSAGYIRIFDAQTGDLYAAFSDPVTSDYLSGITSPKELRIVPYKDTLYIVNRNKRLLISYQATSITLSGFSGVGFPKKLKLFLAYTAQLSNNPNDVVNINNTYTIDLDYFIQLGYNMSNYNTTSASDTEPVARLYTDLFTTLLNDAKTKGVFPDIVPGTPPVSVVRDGSVVTLSAEPGVVMSVEFEDDPYVEEYVTTNGVQDSKPATNVYKTQEELEQAISSGKTMKYVLPSIIRSISLLFITKDLENVSITGPGSPDSTVYIKTVDNNAYIGKIVTDSNYIRTIYLHPRWFLREISDNYPSSNLPVTVTYRGSTITVNYTEQSLNKFQATPEDLPLYEPSLVINFVKNGYLPQFNLGIMSTINSSTDCNIIYNPQNNTWDTTSNLATNLYSSITSQTQFDSNIVVTQTNNNIEIKIPWYYSFSVSVEPVYSAYEINYTIIENGQADLAQGNAPLYIYYANNKWNIEPIKINVSFSTSSEYGAWIIAQTLSQLSGAYVKDLLIYQNRLILLTDRGLIASATNDFTTFIPKDPLTYTEADPFDLTFVQAGDVLEYVLPFSDQLVVFGRHAQYSVFHNGIFSLTNIKVVPATTYDIIPIRPAVAGSEIYFLTPSAQNPNYVTVRKFIVQPNTLIKTALEVTPETNEYIRADVNQLVYLTQADILVIAKNNTENIYLVRNFYQEGTTTSVVFKWNFYFSHRVIAVAKNADGNKLYMINFVDPGTGINWKLLTYISVFDQDLTARAREDIYDCSKLKSYPGPIETDRFSIEFSYTLPINFPQFERLGHLSIKDFQLLVQGESHGKLEIYSNYTLKESTLINVSFAEGSKFIRKILPYFEFSKLLAGRAKIKISTNRYQNEFNNLNLLGIQLVYRAYMNRNHHNEVF